MVGLFNPNALVLSDLSLILNWIVFVGLIVAWYLAFQKKFKFHHKVIWGLLILNFLAILYMDLRLLSVLPNLLNQLEILPLLHSMGGAIAFLLVLYTVLVMSFPHRIPDQFKFKNTFLLMRITAILWLTLVISGTFLYLSWYPL
ncbi:MAG: hypothetical protein EAX86_10400 [Candidatus Heimdallarchaeota archaeon]|nr:hypothetical protein [Candidatus Heimdallarchaeota archaeon]